MAIKRSLNILVTGGAGYIGSILVPELLKKNYSVTVIDNFMYDQVSLLDHCYNSKLTVVRGDARDERLIKESLKKADIIIPLACLTGAPICNRFPQEAKLIILDSIKMLLKYRSKNQIVVYPTTNSGYGLGQKDKFCTE